MRMPGESEAFGGGEAPLVLVVFDRDFGEVWLERGCRGFGVGHGL